MKLKNLGEPVDVDTTITVIFQLEGKTNSD